MQGFNMGRYVPPDVEGTISGNALNKKHALGSRASKLRTEGILTVRFEMPFGVWCGTCPKPTIIGQGVRFNAEKKKVGAYHSTAIWSFRMRHADCGGVIEIRTDPANAEYVVTEGGTRRDTGDDKDDKDDSLVSSSALIGGLGEILTSKEKEALRNDAFGRLEKTIEDRGVLIERSHRIAELEDASHRAWEDPYAQNRRLRAAFRTGRKAREKEAAGTEALQERMSLGIDLLPATEEDARRAALVDFGVGGLSDASSGRDGGNTDRAANSTRAKDAALTKPLFAVSSASGNINHATVSKTGSGTPDAKPEEQQKGKRRLKSEIKASQTRDSLASEITRNTRASRDPFLLLYSGSESRGIGEGIMNSKMTSRIQGIKRKRPDDAHARKSTSIQTSSKHPREKDNGEKKILNKEEDIEKEGKIETTFSETKTKAPGGGETKLYSAPSNTTLVEYDSD